jgi:hypothetical protein
MMRMVRLAGIVVVVVAIATVIDIVSEVERFWFKDQSTGS